MKTNILMILLSVVPFFGFTQNYGRGLNFNDAAYDSVPTKAILVRSLYNNLPATASIKQYAPKPKTQGSYGTCVGWSTTYCALTIIYAKQHGLTDKDEISQHTFSPGFVYKQVKSTNDYSCKFGVYVDDALYVLTSKGAPGFDELEEKNCPTNIPSEIYEKAQNNTIKDYAKIFKESDSDEFKIEATKKSISEEKPVVIGMQCPTSFNTAKDYWQPTEDPAGVYGGHAMCVVGYDDNMYGGAFEIQNSWGMNWGNDGYIWIKYDDYATWTKYAFELIENPVSFKPNEVTLAGTLKFINSDGTEMKAYLNGNRYMMQQPYRSGTRFRFYITNNEPAYVYALGSDQSEKLVQLFPNEEGVSPALTYKKNDVAIPDEDHFIEMDNNEGTDYLCVLYSQNKLDINAIIQKAEKQQGTFQEKVSAAIGDKLFNFADVVYNTNNQIGFNAKGTGKSVVALIVETKHIK